GSTHLRNYSTEEVTPLRKNVLFNLGEKVGSEFYRQGFDFVELIAMIMRTAWRKGDITLKYWASIIVILISYKFGLGQVPSSIGILDRRGDVIEENYETSLEERGYNSEILGIDYCYHYSTLQSAVPRNFGIYSNKRGDVIEKIMRTTWRKGDITLKYWASIIVILISYKVISPNSQEKLYEAMKSTELPEDMDHSQIANHVALRGENSSLLKRLTDISQKYYEAALDNRVLKADAETMRALVSTSC
ncbi:hypothetical protein Tco_1259225, partial [Tanacetum coccineum]